MKITKRQLKRIIKEEKAKLLNESGIDGDPIDWDRDEWTGADASVVPPAPGPNQGWEAAVQWCYDSGMDWQSCVEPLLNAGWPEDELARIEQEFDEMVDLEFNTPADGYDTYHFGSDYGHPQKESVNRITKSRLKRIIKEEYRRVLSEYGDEENYNRSRDRQQRNMAFVSDDSQMWSRLALSTPLPDSMVNQMITDMQENEALDSADAFYLLADLGWMEKVYDWTQANDIGGNGELTEQDVRAIFDFSSATL